MNSVEVLGTMSSIVVAVSLTMKNLRWLRMINLVGAASFSMYGYLIGSVPVLGLNAFIVLINSWYLLREGARKDKFSWWDIGETSGTPNGLLLQFLAHYQADILTFQADWTDKKLAASRVVFVLREALPVSLFVCEPDGHGGYQIWLDYTIPAWRDFRNARFFFREGLPRFAWAQNSVLWTAGGAPAHNRYLKKVGFEQQRYNGQLVWILSPVKSQQEPA